MLLRPDAPPPRKVAVRVWPKAIPQASGAAPPTPAPPRPAGVVRGARPRPIPPPPSHTRTRTHTRALPIPHARPQFNVGHLEVVAGAQEDLEDKGLGGVRLGGNYMSGERAREARGGVAGGLGACLRARLPACRPRPHTSSPRPQAWRWASAWSTPTRMRGRLPATSPRACALRASRGRRRVLAAPPGGRPHPPTHRAPLVRPSLLWRVLRSPCRGNAMPSPRHPQTSCWPNHRADALPATRPSERGGGGRPCAPIGTR